MWLSVFADKPSSPGGPLEASDVTANAITLQWKPPADTGGAKVDRYIVEKRPKGSQRWQKVPGTIREPEVQARNLEEGQEYEFRVAAVNEHGESEPLTTTSAIKAKHPFGEHPTPPSLITPINLLTAGPESIRFFTFY